MSDDQYINRIIFSKYKILKKIGKGSFGTVYSGKTILTEKEIAVKIEKYMFKEKEYQKFIVLEIIQHIIY